MPEPFERLRQARLAAGYVGPVEAARRFGWNRETYKSHENGIRGIRPAKAKLYGDAFKVGAGWILTGEGKGPTNLSTSPIGARERNPLQHAPGEMLQSGESTVPVYGADDGEAGRGLISYKSAVEYAVRPRVLAGVANAFGVYMVGDSMSPRYEQGDVLWIHPGRPLIRGCGVVVVFADNTAMVKRFIAADRKMVEVEQLNPPQKTKLPRADVTGLYRVVGTEDKH